jgi:hypothetical protein
MRRRGLVGAGLATIGAYAFLWLLTLSVAVPRLQHATTTRLQAQLAGLHPGAVIHDCRPGPACPAPNYSVEVSTPIPLVIRVTYSVEAAPLAGSGTTEWWVWVFGRGVMFATSVDWIS